MPLSHEDVKAGVVAYLSAHVLAADHRVRLAPGDDRHVFRDGPWLCVASNGQTAVWLSMTSRQRNDGRRYQIDRSKFQCGPYRFLTTPNFITDLRHPYTGPIESFVAASRIEYPHFSADRPVLSLRALQDVIARMRYFNSMPDIELEPA